MKYELELTHQYLKDLKLARKRGLDICFNKTSIIKKEHILGMCSFFAIFAPLKI